MLMRGLRELLNFAKLCFAQVVYHNPTELNSLAIYAQA
jgi:hypothetical protein